MDIKEKEENKYLLQKEARAKKYMLMGFMFGVFFLATLKDLISSGFDSASVIVRMALIVVFIIITVYFFQQSKEIFDDEDEDKLDNYREFLENNQIQEVKKQSLIEQYFTEADLPSIKKTIYIFWVIIFVIFMSLVVLFYGEPPNDTEKKDKVTNSVTITK